MPCFLVSLAFTVLLFAPPRADTDQDGEAELHPTGFSPEMEEHFGPAAFLRKRPLG
jgi:hypothetical protein